MESGHLTLKWGTLKSWHVTTARGREALREYMDIGASVSAMCQRDTPRQKELICVLIDECEAPTIHLDWEGRDVSKQEAKDYVMTYGKKEVM